MDSPDPPVNLSTALARTNTNQNADICCPFQSHYVEVYATRVLAVLNILLAVLATCLNILVFIAVRRNSPLRLPSKLLFLSLICTDLGTGALTQPLFAADLLAKTTNSTLVTACFFQRLKSLAMSYFCAVSLSTITAICLDRFTAFFFHLKYKEIVTTKRVCFFAVTSWSFSSVFASSLYWSIALHHYTTICGLTSCLSTITAAYIKIYRGLRQHHGHQVQDQAQAQVAATALDMAKYRRTASSMMWIYGLFLFCYVPFFCVHLLRLYCSYDSLTRVLYNLSLTLVLLNSSLNPLVYCFRLPEIHAGVTGTVRKMLCKIS